MVVELSCHVVKKKKFWELISWYNKFIRVDLVRVDLERIDLVRVDLVRPNPSMINGPCVDQPYTRSTFV